MQTSDSWNKIVSQYNKIRNNKEEVVQASWEFIFSTLFNYSDPEIDSQRPVQMGSTPKYPDIIIKNENEDLFVVELKQHTLHKGQDQLISYLNQLKVNIGILVCDNLYIYDFDYTARENAYSVLEIPFTQDNPNGSKFIELFSKENFDKQKIKDFIKESNNKKNAESEMKNELTSGLVIQLLKNYFVEKYPTINVQEILENYDFIVSYKSSVLPIENTETSEIMLDEPQSAKHFIFNNFEYGKGRVVLSVVQYYVKQHPEITYRNLKMVFPDSLQGGQFGVIQNDATVKETVLRNYSDKNSAYKKRFFSKSNEKIILPADGTTIIVSTQWGDNFDNFFKRAKELGLNVEKR